MLPNEGLLASENFILNNLTQFAALACVAEVGHTGKTDLQMPIPVFGRITVLVQTFQGARCDPRFPVADSRERETLSPNNGAGKSSCGAATKEKTAGMATNVLAAVPGLRYPRSAPSAGPTLSSTKSLPWNWTLATQFSFAPWRHRATPT